MTQHVLTDAEMHALICGNPSTIGLSIARLKDFIRQVEKAVMAKLVAEQEPIAWVHPNDPTRSITQHQKEGAIKDGGAIEKTTRVFSIPAYAHPMPSKPYSIDKDEVGIRELVASAITGTIHAGLEGGEAPPIGHWLSEFYEYGAAYEHIQTQLQKNEVVCISCATNKAACVSESGENDRQLARQQPCGCVVCYCENQERCLGCGAKYCGTHDVGEIPNPVYVDHIADASKMVDADHIPDIGQMITPLAQRKIQSLLDKGEYRVIENATVLVNENGHAAIVNKGGAFYWVDNEALAREFDGVGVGVDSHHITDMRKKVPEGWQLVPVEPIEEMLKKAFPEIFDIDGISKNDLIERYQAMLAEAPKYTGDSNE